MSSHPYLAWGISPIFVLYFEVLFMLSQRLLASNPSNSAMREGLVFWSSYFLTNPITSPVFMKSNNPSLPMTMNSSCGGQISIALISGSLISPTFLASKSPRVREMAIPGPSSSTQIRNGPTGLSLINICSILPPIFRIRAFSSGRVGF